MKTTSNYAAAIRVLLLVALTLGSLLLATAPAHADTLGTSPAFNAAGTGQLTGCTGSACAVQCTPDLGAVSANWTYATPFPWCNGAIPTGFNLSTSAYCPSGFYAWSFYGTMADPTYAWTASRIPIYNNCPRSIVSAWVISPSPAAAGYSDLEAVPQIWRGGQAGGSQRYEFLNQGGNAGLPLWNVPGSAYYAPGRYEHGTGNLGAAGGGANIQQSATSCMDLQTNTTATYIKNIAADYAASRSPSAATTDADRIYSIYTHYLEQFPVTSANRYPVVADIKVGLSSSTLPFNTERGFIKELGAKYGTGQQCGSMLQFASLTTDPRSQLMVNGSCIIATNRLEMGVDPITGLGAIPTLRLGQPVGGNRFAINGEYAQKYQNRVPTAAAYPSNVPVAPAFTSWREKIKSILLEFNKYPNKPLPVDSTYVGAAYASTSNPSDAPSPLSNTSNPGADPTLADTQASQHAVCTTDAPVILLKPGGTIPTTTTTSPGGGGAKTTTTTRPTTPTTRQTTPTTRPTTTIPQITVVTNPPTNSPMQTVTANIPVFADGGSLRQQNFSAEISRFATRTCNSPSKCTPDTLSIRANIVGQDGYTQCSSPSQRGCSFYVVSTPSDSNPYDASRTWTIEFFSPTNQGLQQKVQIAFLASGTYTDWFLRNPPPIRRHFPALKTKKLCIMQGGMWAQGACSKFVQPPPILMPTSGIPYSVYVTPAFSTRYVSGSVPSG
jgi:hypothetical protein